MKHPLLIIFISIAGTFLLEKVWSQNALLPPKNGKVYVIAHRGVHNEIPENSLAAYQKAIDLGCDFVEIDARTTKDGEIVSIHNKTVDAYVVGKTGMVSELTLAELKSLDIGERLGSKWKNTRIPTFDEILELCQGKIGIYLDLKDADPALLISKIRQYQMERQIVWYIPASYHKTIMEIMQTCPECMVMPDPGSEQNIEQVVTAYRPKVIATDMGHLSETYTEKAHKNMIMVFVDDNEDDPAKKRIEWDKIMNWETDGIQTDQPEELIEYVKEKNRDQ